jgi:3-oxoacyl-[acyl-carrier-protein] synthase II
MSGIAITGAGLITSIGTSRRQCFEAFVRGTSGLKPLVHLDPGPFRIHGAYELAESFDGESPEKHRASHLLARAVAEAVAEARLAPGARRVVALIGTGLGELRSLELWYADGHGLRLSDLHFGQTVRAVLGCACPVFTISNACSASSFALGLAADLLELGEADVAVVGGCDTITASMFGFLDLGSPNGVPRVEPFDRKRQGVLLGEGAASVVLERAGETREAPLAVVRGVGMGCDAVHPTALDREGILAAMRDAHQRAGTRPEEVDLMVVHGTGTLLNDHVEALALRELLGAAVGRVPVTALKSMIGHTSGASGLVGVVAALETMRQHLIPPTINHIEPMPEAEELDVVTHARPAHVRLAQVNAFGFGGVNAVVLIERAGDAPA